MPTGTANTRKQSEDAALGLLDEMFAHDDSGIDIVRELTTENRRGRYTGDEQLTLNTCPRSVRSAIKSLRRRVGPGDFEEPPRDGTVFNVCLVAGIQLIESDDDVIDFLAQRDALEDIDYAKVKDAGYSLDECRAVLDSPRLGVMTTTSHGVTKKGLRVPSRVNSELDNLCMRLDVSKSGLGVLCIQAGLTTLDDDAGFIDQDAAVSFENVVDEFKTRMRTRARIARLIVTQLLEEVGT